MQTFTPEPPPACEDATLQIIALDKVDEVITLQGTGNVGGWWIQSTKGLERFYFPEGILMSGGQVRVHSSLPAVTPSGTDLFWAPGSPIWDDGANDDALLYDCMSIYQGSFDDGHP